MKRLILVAIFLLLATQTSAGAPASQTDVDAAKMAVKSFAGALKTELTTVMQVAGPVAAIDVCNTRARPIADLVSEEKGMQLSRVSLKNRNPDNAPNDWQQAVLLDFEAQKDSGKSISGLAWSETAETEQGREFRFMKAIPTGGVCLVCHGSAISPEVEQKLAELYPHDKATGFKEGDIRGAFVVTRKLAD